MSAADEWDEEARGDAAITSISCTGCKKAIVERDIFAVTRLGITDGKCRFYGTKIAGVLDGTGFKAKGHSQTIRLV